MKTAVSFSRATARIALLCTLAVTAISVSSVAAAGNGTLTLSGTPSPTVSASQSYSFQPVAYDSLQRHLRYFCNNQPGWAQFNTETGLFTGRPSNRDVGTYKNIKIIVDDGYGYAEVAFSINVLPESPNTGPTVPAAGNRTLTLSGTPSPTVSASQSYSFQPVAYDSLKRHLRYFCNNQPGWAQFNTDTGLFTGRPSNRNVGTYKNIKIIVDDGYGHAEVAFSINVVPESLNTAPTISGRSAASVAVGTAYNFTPAATDAEHNPLTFSVQNKPSWANFSTASGALTGTPTAADVGTYSNVQISVSDGQASVSLPAFTLTVNQIATGNVTLDWTPPTENSDASVLTDLAGYKIHYGTSKDQLTQTAYVANPGLTSYVLGQLSAGTWYFDMTAYSKSGAESEVSGVVSTTIQ